MSKQKELFKKKVWEYYHKNKRDDMLWRKTKNPYHILISEIMLQQTQVNRVTNKYQEFIQKFPTTKSLANAQLGEVLRVWQGLGYNRRAKYLKEAAEKIEKEYNGQFPKTKEKLLTLPGIGEATAGAIIVYAYNIPTTYIETNIRTVYMYHFYKNKEEISDEKIEKLVTQTLDPTNPREWYWALMDYGTHLKKIKGNNIKKSKHYVKQSTFKDSRRQKRGAIIRYLTKNKTATLLKLQKETNIEKTVLKSILQDLEREKMIHKENKSYKI